MLLTSESVTKLDEANQTVDIYTRRWQIEEFHKAWKSGVGVENRRMGTADNIERIAVILAFIAVRLLQIRELAQDEPRKPCTTVLRPIEWQCLWAAVETRRLPRRPPPLRWAYCAIAKLGGWIDTKGTGRVGWQTMWIGWQRLEERLDAFATMSRHGIEADL